MASTTASTLAVAAAVTTPHTTAEATVELAIAVPTVAAMAAMSVPAVLAAVAMLAPMERAKAVNMKPPRSLLSPRLLFFNIAFNFLRSFFNFGFYANSLNSVVYNFRFISGNMLLYTT